jgi:hypothetical protein
VGIATYPPKLWPAALIIRKLTFAAVPIVVKKAQPWSLFNPAVHDAHFAELRRLLQSAQKQQH